MDPKGGAIIGAGMHGTATAYNLTRFGAAGGIQIADRDPTRA